MSLWASSVSVVFAALAAILWAGSSLINLPVLGSGYGALANVEPFYAAMKKIARLNAGAAACAFVSALSQAIVFFHTP